MNIINFLEQLACTVHHRTDLEKKLSEQSCEVKKAFLTGNSSILKAHLNSTEILADRTTIFQIHNFK